MKIAISSTGPQLDAPMDQRFGRCPCFIVVDPANEEFEVLDNQAAMMSGGAGIQAAQMVINSGAEAVITGNLGPNAADTLAAAGVNTYLGATGTIREVLQQYKAGQLRKSSAPTVESHFSTGGMGGKTGAGRGMGRGPGRGRGGGLGMGRGMGRGAGRGMDRGYSLEPQPSPSYDLGELKDQKDQLQKQMNRIEERIRKLEKKK